MKRGPGRPRIERGHVGRPRKVYQMVPNIQPEPITTDSSESIEEFTDCQDFAGVAEVTLKQALSSSVSKCKGWKDAILSEVISLSQK